MEKALKAFLELLRQPPLIVGIVGVWGMAFSLFLLLLPDTYASRLHYAAWRNDNGHWLLIAIGVFSLLTVLAVALFISARMKKGESRREVVQRDAWIGEAVASLRLDERLYLAYCSCYNRAGLFADESNGSIATLCNKGLLSKSGRMRMMKPRRWYDVPPPVLEYMRQNEKQICETFADSGEGQREMKEINDAQHGTDDNRVAVV